MEVLFTSLWVGKIKFSIRVFNLTYLKRALFLSLLLLISKEIFSQSDYIPKSSYNKGKFYFYWGWNFAAYSNSDITFKGEDYNFTLNHVVAKDRQSPLSFDYINPTRMTIPQYNFRIGYFFHENWNISIGNDHMKYVVFQGQEAEINGYIKNSETLYDGEYNGEEITIEDGFLEFEHTDGLNYENIEIRHFRMLIQKKEVRLNLTEGIGAGMLLPKTNSTLLGNERNDEFHIAGYGISAVLALQADYRGGFFIQTEFKGGYLNMPDILTTKFSTDRASQDFFFFQYNVVLGYQFSFKKRR